MKQYLNYLHETKATNNVQITDFMTLIKEKKTQEIQRIQFPFGLTAIKATEKTLSIVYLSNVCTRLWHPEQGQFHRSIEWRSDTCTIGVLCKYK